ncbi:MAG: type II toxin-antitoxin system RelE/ParE family toxin [Clostridiales bacterium]|nr:type II toxin-antitoxin system RelE/ParE family toxin [Clostridiales bacterium]
MYKIEFYEDENGRSSLKEYIRKLKSESIRNKDSRIKFTKTVAYIDALQEMGTRMGEPVTKHLDGEIWELRPLSIRITYAFIGNNTYLLLHHFIKQTDKTPRREIEKSKRELADYRRRISND